MRDLYFRPHEILKLSLTAVANRSIALSMLSSDAEAKFVRKKSSLGARSRSVRNHDPQAARTPFSMHDLKIPSSISRIDLVDASGCFVWSTFNQI